MKNKKGMSTISIICFLGMISIISLSILALEINKADLIKIGCQPNLPVIKAQEDALSVLGEFKKNIEKKALLDDDESTESLMYDEISESEYNMSVADEFNNEKFNIEEALKIKFENSKGIVRYKEEAPHIEVQLKMIWQREVKFLYYNYKIDDSKITFIEY